MWEYRSSIARLIWPMIASMVLSGTPASAILVAAVCLRSCKRQVTPARFRIVPQAVLHGRGWLGWIVRSRFAVREQVEARNRLAEALGEPLRMNREHVEQF